MQGSGAVRKAMAYGATVFLSVIILAQVSFVRETAKIAYEDASLALNPSALRGTP